MDEMNHRDFNPRNAIGSSQGQNRVDQSASFLKDGYFVKSPLHNGAPQDVEKICWQFSSI
jgi:hypothetical protein